MAMFNVYKRKNQNPFYTIGESDYSSLRIEVIGGEGCASCEALYKQVVASLEQLGLCEDEHLLYTKDISKAMALGVMSIPVLLINGDVKSVGKVLKSDEIVKMIKESCLN